MKYYVLFMEPDVPAWWMAKLKKGFRHCGLLKEYDEGIYVYLENLYDSLHIDLCMYDLNAIQRDTGAVIVEYEYERTCDVRMNHFEPITCVTVIKKTLGIADIKIQTPYQLFKHLLRNGGKIWEP